MIRTVPVGLGERAYDVVIGPGLIDRAGERIAPVLGKRKRVAIVTDTIVGEHHGERLAASLERPASPSTSSPYRPARRARASTAWPSFPTTCWP